MATEAIAAAAAPTAPKPPVRDPKMWQAAQDFEAVMLGQMAKDMFGTRGAGDDKFNGGFAEETWRGVFAEEIGKDMSRRGGVGIAEAIYHEMVRRQGGAQ